VSVEEVEYFTVAGSLIIRDYLQIYFQNYTTILFILE